MLLQLRLYTKIHGKECKFFSIYIACIVDELTVTTARTQCN